MIMNATKEHSTGEEDVSRDNETKGILKTIDQRRLNKKKGVPNQWPDHPTKHSIEPCWKIGIRILGDSWRGLMRYLFH